MSWEKNYLPISQSVFLSAMKLAIDFQVGAAIEKTAAASKNPLTKILPFFDLHSKTVRDLAVAAFMVVSLSSPNPGLQTLNDVMPPIQDIADTYVEALDKVWQNLPDIVPSASATEMTSAADFQRMIQEKVAQEQAKRQPAVDESVAAQESFEERNAKFKAGWEKTNREMGVKADVIGLESLGNGSMENSALAELGGDRTKGDLSLSVLSRLEGVFGEKGSAEFFNANGGLDPQKIGMAIKALPKEKKQGEEVRTLINELSQYFKTPYSRVDSSAGFTLRDVKSSMRKPGESLNFSVKYPLKSQEELLDWVSFTHAPQILTDMLKNRTHPGAVRALESYETLVALANYNFTNDTKFRENKNERGLDHALWCDMVGSHMQRIKAVYKDVTIPEKFNGNVNQGQQPFAKDITAPRSVADVFTPDNSQLPEFYSVSWFFEHRAELLWMGVKFPEIEKNVGAMDQVLGQYLTGELELDAARASFFSKINELKTLGIDPAVFEALQKDIDSKTVQHHLEVSSEIPGSAVHQGVIRGFTVDNNKDMSKKHVSADYLKTMVEYVCHSMGIEDKGSEKLLWVTMQIETDSCRLMQEIGGNGKGAYQWMESTVKDFHANLMKQKALSSFGPILKQFEDPRLRKPGMTEAQVSFANLERNPTYATAMTAMRFAAYCKAFGKFGDDVDAPQTMKAIWAAYKTYHNSAYGAAQEHHFVESERVLKGRLAKENSTPEWQTMLEAGPKKEFASLSGHTANSSLRIENPSSLTQPSSGLASPVNYQPSAGLISTPSSQPATHRAQSM